VCSSWKRTIILRLCFNAFELFDQTATGVITSTVLPQREIQFGLKLHF
jgi:hypothetical protein